MNLVTSRNEVDVEFLGKSMDHIFIEHIAHASLALSPVWNLVLLWVCPQQIAKQTLVWNVCWSFDHFKIAVIVEFLAKTTMHAQYFIVDQSGDRQLLEDADEFLEHLAVLLIVAGQLETGLTLPLEQRFVESVNVGQIVAFVIASKKKKVLWVFYFECEQEKDSFDLHRASSLVIA